MTDAINVAAMCDKGMLPVAGGIADQSAWFLSLWQQLTNDQNKIDAERIERQNSE